MKKFIAILSLTFLCLSAFSMDIKGLVVDGKDQPLPYACIYIQRDPNIGTVTDDNGNFELSVDYNKYYGDTLVISYIGYTESRTSIYNLYGWIEQSGPNAIMKFRLQGEPLQLSEARLTEKKGKSKKGEIENLLKLVGQKLEQDFPQEVRQYKIKADSYMKNKDKVMGVEQDVGIVTETPTPDATFPVKTKFRTSIHKYNVDPKIDSYLKGMRSEYEASKSAPKDSTATKPSKDNGPTTEEYLEKLSTNDIDNKDVKSAAKKASEEDVIEKHVQRLDSKDVVKFIGNAWPSWFLLMFDEFSKDVDDWSINKLSEDEYLLHYYNRKRFIGIVKAEHDVTLRVNMNDYSIKSYYQNVKVHANIPFGYKLSKKELAILNGFTGMDMNRFKLKKMDANVDHSAFFVRKNGKLIPTEKTYTGEGYAYDRKDKGVNLNAAVKLSVLQAL
jgi:hypothetical protein